MCGSHKRELSWTDLSYHLDRFLKHDVITAFDPGPFLRVYSAMLQMDSYAKIDGPWGIHCLAKVMHSLLIMILRGLAFDTYVSNV